MVVDATGVRLSELERRVGKLEDVEPDVMAERVKQLTRRVDTLIKLAIAILVAFVSAAITFLFMIVNQLGHG